MRKNFVDLCKIVFYLALIICGTIGVVFASEKIFGDKWGPFCSILGFYILLHIFASRIAALAREKDPVASDKE